MDLVNVPPELQSLKMCAKYAVALEKKHPIISYYIWFHVAGSGLDLPDRSPETNTYLSSVLDRLEVIKTQHQDTQEINDEASGIAFVEKFAMETFNQLDSEQVQGDPDRQMKLCTLAIVLFEVAQKSGKGDPELSEMTSQVKTLLASAIRSKKTGEAPSSQPSALSTVTPNTNNLMNSQPASKPQPTLYSTSQTDKAESHANSVTIDIDTDWNLVAKYASWAITAANCYDKDAAITNLEAAIALLKKGQ